MKKVIAIVVILISTRVYSQTNPKIKENLDYIQTYEDRLKKKLDAPDWSGDKFFLDFRSDVTQIQNKINNIKNIDAAYDVSELEKKYTFYKAKQDEGRKLMDAAKDSKEKSQNQALVAKYLVKDEGMTNPVHEKYAGKIVFSSSEISKTTPDESKFGNNFSISAPIYVRLYLKTSIFNEVQKNRSSEAFDNQVGLLYKIYLDGAVSEQGRVEFSQDGKKFLTPDQIKTQTSIGGIFNFNKDAFLSSAYIDGLVASDAKLTDGKHSFKIELFPIYNSMKPLTDVAIASGEFNLNVSKGFINSNSAACMPKAVKKDAALETKYKDCVKKYLVNNNKDAVMKGFVLLSSDWEIRKNEITSVPISRTMYGAAGLSYKDGKCKYETFSFTQNWNGSSYSSTIETSSTGQDGNMFCDCLK